VLLKKDLYGLAESALLCHELLSKSLREIGYEDACITAEKEMELNLHYVFTFMT